MQASLCDATDAQFFQAVASSKCAGCVRHEAIAANQAESLEALHASSSLKRDLGQYRDVFNARIQELDRPQLCHISL